MSASRNLGIRHAKGEYIAFLDADDVWLAHNLERQVAILGAYPEAGMVYGNTQYWYSWTGDPQDNERDFVPDLGVETHALFDPPTLLTSFLQNGNTVPCMCSLVVRRGVAEDTGGFEEDFRGLYEDQAFYVKVCLTAPVLAVDERRARYRQHEDASSSIALRTGEYDPVKPNPARHNFLKWVAAYLKKHKVKNTEIWRVLQRELQTYLHPSAPIDVVGVSLGEGDDERLWGCNIEAPQPGLRSDGHELALIGWVVGRRSPAVAVEVVHEGTVAQRAPVDVRRPDVAAAFPEIPGAANSGFRTTMSVTGMGGLEVGVRAVLRDQSRVPLGTIRARRRWREEDLGVGAALVSVVIPCHDQARFLGEAIESVLAQTYPHFEVVVVDDGSTDNTQEVASRYPGVRCVRQDNLGLAAARNTGIRRSRGEYLVFLDADDRLLPDALEAGLSALKDRPECAFVAGRYRYIAFDGSSLPTPQPPWPDGDHYLALLRHNYILVPATVMYRRPIFEHVTGFDHSVSPAEDYDLYLRVARKFPIYCHEAVVSEHRQKDAKLLSNSWQGLISNLNVLQSQRRYMKQSKRYCEAHRRSVMAGRANYCEQLIEEVRTYARKHKKRQAIRGMMTLLRYCPRGLLSPVHRIRS